MASAALTEMVCSFKESIDKKQRNLIKRKAKLDQYRASLSRGEVLQADQAKAIQNYETVRSNITLIGEIVEHTNQFTEKMCSEIQRHDETTSRHQQDITVASCAKMMLFRNVLNRLHFPPVQEAVTRELGAKKCAFLNEMAAKISSMDEFPAAVFSDEAYLDVAQTLWLLVSPPEVPQSTENTTFTFQEAHEMILSLLRSPRVTSALQGKPFEEEEEEPEERPVAAEVVVVEEEPMLEKTVKTRRFNFLQPSIVSEEMETPANGPRKRQTARMNLSNGPTKQHLNRLTVH